MPGLNKRASNQTETTSTKMEDCLLGDSNSFCQINLLFVFFFQFSLNVVCNYHIYIQHIIASYSCTYIIRSLAKNTNYLETIFNLRNILFPFQLQNKGLLQNKNAIATCTKK